MWYRWRGKLPHVCLARGIFHSAESDYGTFINSWIRVSINVNYAQNLFLRLCSFEQRLCSFENLN